MRPRMRPKRRVGAHPGCAHPQLARVPMLGVPRQDSNPRTLWLATILDTEFYSVTSVVNSGRPSGPVGPATCTSRDVSATDGPRSFVPRRSGCAA